MTDNLYLGIEFGSTRIKAVLIDDAMAVVATGSHTWENQLVDGYWTYDLDAVWIGVAEAYARMAADYLDKHSRPLTGIASIGVSAMMHGYLPFSADGELLAGFRTWRNTTTGEAADELTAALDFVIPQRWSIAHLYQAVLNSEAHVPQISFLTSLAGYVHWKLTGEKVLGVGDGSGVFPVDPVTHRYDAKRLAIVQDMLAKHHVPWSLTEILPTVVDAGGEAGRLTDEGARLLDRSGTLSAGIPFAPPEGDAGTGMVATNAVAPRTGNISAGTSIFAMVVLERPLSKLHPEIDIVATPAGDTVAMVHCNNGASEIDVWARIFAEFASRVGRPSEMKDIFSALFNAAIAAPADGGGWTAYNYLAGEPITGLAEGRPLIVRAPDSMVGVGAFMRTLIMSAYGTLAVGMRILTEEAVEVDSMFAHGGVFATPGVAQRLLAAALNAPVSVGQTASEGGAWGMAVLAGYAINSAGRSLPDFLNQEVFGDASLITVEPDPADVEGFAKFMARYEPGLDMVRAAIATV